MEIKNYGIDIEREKRVQDGTEHRFGGASKECAAMIPSGERVKYLPKGESQNIGEDKQSCVTRDFAEIIETKLNFLYQNNLFSPEARAFFETNGYVTEDGKIEIADAYNAYHSGTTRNGNSFKEPLQSFHNNGIVPKKLLPQLERWDDHYNPARFTDEINELGQESKKYVRVWYDQVFAKDFKEAIKKYLLGAAGYAWPHPVNGVYPRTDLPFNHSFPLIEPEYLARDSYIDAVDGDYEKQLAPDYKFFDWGYRIYLELPKPEEKKDFCNWNWLTEIICALFGKKSFSWR